MTYVINISGTDGALQGDEKAQFDQDCIDKARAFVGDLAGVTTATISTNTQGSTDLKATS
jgi:hypothetical protein